MNGNGDQRAFSALKGPMFTQTMRGMSTHGHLHWRGDRATGYFGTDDGEVGDLDEKLPLVSNPDQADRNRDGQGDACAAPRHPTTSHP